MSMLIGVCGGGRRCPSLFWPVLLLTFLSCIVSVPLSIQGQGERIWRRVDVDRRQRSGRIATC